MQLIRGQKVALATLGSGSRVTIALRCDAPGRTVDYTCFALGGNEKVIADAFIVFFNQAATPCGAIRYLAGIEGYDCFDVDLELMREDVQQILFCATGENDASLTGLARCELVLALDGERVATYEIEGDELGPEPSLTIGRLYRRPLTSPGDGRPHFEWKFDAMGLNTPLPLAALIENMGGSVASDPPAPPPSPPPQAPSIPLTLAPTPAPPSAPMPMPPLHVPPPPPGELRGGLPEPRPEPPAPLLASALPPRPPPTIFEHPDALLHCGACARWECLEEDSYCGRCGQALKQIELEPPVVAFAGAARSSEKTLVLRNASYSKARVIIGQDSASRTWLNIVHPPSEAERVAFESLTTALEDGRSLGAGQRDAAITLFPGEEYALTLNVAGRLAATARELSGAVLVGGEGITGRRGQPLSVRRVPVTWGEHPQPAVVVPRDPSICLGLEMPVDLRVANPRAGFATLLRPPAVSVDWIRVKEYPEDPIAPGLDGIVTLVTDTTWSPPGKHSVNVTLEFAELDAPVIATVPLAVLYPPRIYLSRTRVTFGELTPYSDRAEHRVQVENRGEADLQLLGGPRVEPAELARSVRVIDDDPSHRRIQSARHGHPGKVFTLRASGRDLAPGTYSGRVIFPSNDESQREAFVTLQLSVQALAPHDRLLALDFGTSNSCIAQALNPGDYRVLDLSGGGAEPCFEVASVVHFTTDGQVLIGEEARNAEVGAPDRTISSIKRWLGTARNLVLRGLNHTPRQIAVTFLRKLWERAAVELKAEPRELVVTVPCRFGRGAIDELLAACREAGFEPHPEPVLVLDEPAAVAYRYLYQFHEELSRSAAAADRALKVLVFDIGGGTLDVALLEVRFGKNPHTLIRPLAVDGMDLGGDDLDALLVDMLLERLRAARDADPRGKLARLEVERIKQADVGSDPDSFANLTSLRRAAEYMKQRLSTEECVSLPPIYLRDRVSSPVLLEESDAFMRVERAEFEARALPLLNEGAELMQRLLKHSGVAPSDVELLLMTGGTSRCPVVRRTAQAVVPRAHAPGPDEILPKHSVSLGAATFANLRKFELSSHAQGDADVRIEPMRDRTYFSIGTIRGGRFVEVVPRGGLPLRGEYVIARPSGPESFLLVRNNGSTDERFRETKQLADIGHVALDPARMPESAPGTLLSLELEFQSDRTLRASVQGFALDVVLKPGALQ